MLTIEEQERRAYISGNVELAAALAAIDEDGRESEDELRHDRDMMSAELRNTTEELDAAHARIAELEAEIEDARA